MNIISIHTAFADLLEPNNLVKQRRRRNIGLTGKKAAGYRYQLKHGNGIRIEHKLRWLQKAGIDVGIDQHFNRADMLLFLKFSRRKDSIRSAATLGDDYLIEKFLIWRQQGMPAVIRTGVRN